MSSWEGISPDVAAIMGEAQDRREERHLSESERRALRRIREAERRAEERRRAKAAYDAARNKKSYDVPAFLSDAIEEVADRLGVSASGVASALMAEGLRRYRRNELQISTTICDSPRFERQVEISERDAGF